MAEITLIVEGAEDIRFLQDFIWLHFNKKEIQIDEFINIGGKSETLHAAQVNIQTKTDKGSLNVLIFDADDKDHKSTLININSKARKLELTFDHIFLFPDDKSKGNLESLLKSSVTKGNEKLFDCIEAYANCRADLNLKNPRPIDEKEKIRIYQGSFVETSKVKGSARSYHNNDIWDLHSPALLPLKNFLAKFFA